MAAKPDKFWDKIAETYAAQPISDQASYEAKLEMTRSYFTPDTQVLELGCGTGSTAILHAPHVKHIRATDISENMLAIGRERAKAAGVDNISFERGAVEDLEVADNSLDVVLALNLLHLLDDPDAAIVKIHRMLKPGGVFVSSTGLLKQMPVYIRLALPLAQLIGKAPPVRHMSAADVSASVENAGFMIDRDWTPPKQPVVFLAAKKPQ